MSKRTLDERLRDHSREIEKNQSALRRSIADVQRLTDDAERMLERHRREHLDESCDKQEP